MPTSEPANLSPIMTEVVRLQPRSVYDVGVGCGKYGVLCREYLDGAHGRVKPQDWQTIIHGCEGFTEYKNPLWYAYSFIDHCAFQKAFESVKHYDLVLMLDVLEHFDEVEGATILRYLVENNKNVIVSVPLGECPQGECFGNELERHRTTFTGRENFRQYKYRVIHKAVCLVLSISGVAHRENGVREL